MWTVLQFSRRSTPHWGRYLSSKNTHNLDKFITAAKSNNEGECEAILDELNVNDVEIINGFDSFGNSLLMLCSQRNWVECCESLLSLNCEVNHQNVFGSSALMCGMFSTHFLLTILSTSINI